MTASEIDKIKSIIDDLQWAKNTIEDSLKFGLPESEAIKRRESRCNGVFMTVIEELKELTDGCQMDTYSSKQ